MISWGNCDFLRSEKKSQLKLQFPLKKKVAQPRNKQTTKVEKCVET